MFVFLLFASLFPCCETHVTLSTSVSCPGSNRISLFSIRETDVACLTSVSCPGFYRIWLFSCRETHLAGPTSVSRELHAGNFKQETANYKRGACCRNQDGANIEQTRNQQDTAPQPLSEPQESHFGADAEFCGADEEEPLGKEVAYQDEVVAVWDGLDEFVPGEDEVGEDEEDGSEGEEAAALEHGCDEHGADEDCVDADTDADDAIGGAWDDAGEGGGKECQGAEDHHGEVAFGFSGEFPVLFDLSEVSSGEIYYVPDVSDCEESHLAKEVAA